MDNYKYNCLTTYLTVKSPSSFREALSGIDSIQAIEKAQGFIIIGTSYDRAGRPLNIQNNETGKITDLPEFVSEHLQNGGEAYFLEVIEDRSGEPRVLAEGINSYGERQTISSEEFGEIAELDGSCHAHTEYFSGDVES